MSAPHGPGDALCRCGHPRDVHEHYRKGTDCAVCVECPRYRPAGGVLARLRALVGR